MDTPIPEFTPSAANPVVVAVITEPPGAAALVSCDGPWTRVMPLNIPQRGLHFSRTTALGRVLHDLHEEGALAKVVVNLPERYSGRAEFTLRPNSSIAKLHRHVERMGVPVLLTSTELWRPCFESDEYAHDITETAAAIAAQTLAGLTVSEQEGRSRVDAVLLGMFAGAVGSPVTTNEQPDLH